MLYLLPLQSVVFHFDCVTTTMNKEMHVRLDVSSSPMPNKKPRFVESQAIIGSMYFSINN